MLELSTPVQYVKGIGPRVAEILAGKGISTVEDLLYYLPFRYEDRLNPRGIAELRAGEMATVIAEVRGSGLFRTRRSGTDIFQMTAGQGRAKVTCLWFHGRYLTGKFQPGQLVALYGKVEEDTRGRGGLQIIQPQFEILGEAEDEAADRAAQSLEIGRIVPIYESAANGKLTSRWFRRILHSVLENLTELPESIPEPICERLGLIPRRQAFCQAHWPEAGESLPGLHAARTPAHRRLIFEELFFLELGLELKRRKRHRHAGIAFELNDRVRQTIKRILPFHPTAAQKKVLREIATDMEQPSPMRRLLQGDVGSGKTIVALQAAIIAIENGYQVALMAPTEILATQHYLSARRILERAGYNIVLLTGSLEQDRKRDLRRHIARGDAQLVIGTHALIQETVEFANLGLVIVDEQHRFGVIQRFKLMRKASESQAEGVTSYEPRCTPDGAAAHRRRTPALALAEPDTLVMTATPIPRTLALTIYGDLDASVLDELPPGRSPITTRRVPDERATEVWDFVRKQVKAGHQTYVVYPVIEENEERELKAAIQMYNKLRREILPGLRIGLLHGRLEAEEKDAVMRRFQKGEIDVLVSTTVIEVGVDVRNACVMVIEHAELFGLAQLHQLRGRIGRGPASSYCILMTGRKVSEEAEQRLQAMLGTTDGFKIAELDLELRGPGEFFGTKQAGMPSLRVANIVRDRDLLELAKKEAADLLAGSNLEVPNPELARAFGHLRSHWNRRYGLVKVG
ncbi:MAG TPA: ATP-dependent DNA helicase RecG [Terriglobales bacterium]|nr:ATP-dependent DNA helicase RecG [Terriglobales bacterium]